MFIDLPQRKQSCAVYHMQMALVPYGWQWHARASNQIKTCACDVLFNLSSFHEHPCHLAAVIPFYYHGLACELFEIIPIKLALIKMYSNKRQWIWCGEWKNSWKRNIKFICSTWWHSVFLLLLFLPGLGIKNFSELFPFLKQYWNWMIFTIFILLMVTEHQMFFTDKEVKR